MTNFRFHDAQTVNGLRTSPGLWSANDQRESTITVSSNVPIYAIMLDSIRFQCFSYYFLLIFLICLIFIFYPIIFHCTVLYSIHWYRAGPVRRARQCGVSGAPWRRSSWTTRSPPPSTVANRWSKQDHQYTVGPPLYVFCSTAKSR